MQVSQAEEIQDALKARVRRIEIQVPQGQTVAQFIGDMVLQAATMPEMGGYDPYEIEAILRDMAGQHH